MDYTIDRFVLPEETNRRGRIIFVGCGAAKELTTKVHAAYEDIQRQRYEMNDNTPNGKAPLLTSVTRTFEDEGRDGTCVRLPESVDGKDAFVFQNCMDKREARRSLNENLMQLYQVVCTLHEHGAANITVITPYFPYGRQDRPTTMQREIAFADEVSLLFKNKGVDRFLCYSPHSTGIVHPFRYISSLDVIIDHFSFLKGDPRTAVMSTDAGGAKEYEAVADALGLRFAQGSKKRSSDQRTVTGKGVIGDFNGITRVLMPDDESASASSLMTNTVYLNENTQVEEIIWFVSHLRLSPKYIPLLLEAQKKYKVSRLVTTDSIPPNEAVAASGMVEFIDLTRMWAHVVDSIHRGQSMSARFFKPVD